MFNPYVSYGVIGPGYFVVPKVQWHFASYDLSHISSTAPAGQPKAFTESIPTLSFDSGLVFDRSVRLFGDDYIQTLEPRLYYVYTPYRDQKLRADVRYRRSGLRPRRNLYAEYVRRQRPDRRRESPHGRR